MDEGGAGAENIISAPQHCFFPHVIKKSLYCQHRRSIPTTKMGICGEFRFFLVHENLAEKIKSAQHLNNAQ